MIAQRGSFRDHGQKSCLGISDTALSVRIGRIEVNGIAFVQYDLLIGKYNGNAALQHQIELLSGMRYELGRFIGRLQRERHGCWRGHGQRRQGQQ